MSGAALGPTSQNRSDEASKRPCHYVFIYPQIKKLTGAQRLILALAGAVSQPHQRVTLLTHQFAPACRDALPAQVQLIESGHNLNRSGNHYLDSIIEYAAVPALLKQLPPDTNAVCFFGPPSLPGLWWAKKVRRLKIPLLYFCYEPPRAAYTDRREVSQRLGRVIGPLANLLFGLYRPLDKYLARQADAVLVNGEYGRSLIKQTYGLDSTVITHGFDLPTLPDSVQLVQQIRDRYHLGTRPVILTVNHLHPRKRIELLLQAMPAILAKCPEATALIVGQGPEEAALKAVAAQLGLNSEQVIWAGFVPENELAGYYQAAQVYVHTGKAESFGLAVLEASANGLPVVAADEGGPREILQQDKTGFLVKAEPQQFADKVSWLLQNPKQAREMGAAGTARTRQHYTWQQGAHDFTNAALKLGISSFDKAR